MTEFTLFDQALKKYNEKKVSPGGTPGKKTPSTPDPPPGDRFMST